MNLIPIHFYIYELDTHPYVLLDVLLILYIIPTNLVSIRHTHL